MTMCGERCPSATTLLAQSELIEHGEAVGGDVEEEPGVGVGLLGGLEHLDVPSGALRNSATAGPATPHPMIEGA